MACGEVLDPLVEVEAPVPAAVVVNGLRPLVAGRVRSRTGAVLGLAELWAGLDEE